MSRSVVTGFPMVLDDVVVALSGPQTVAGAKTWSDAAVFSSTVGVAGAATFDTTSTFTGVETFSTMFKIPSATVAATGTVQADAALIATGFTLVSGADDTKGVKLPAAAAGLVCIIKVGTGADLKVWPNTSDAINAIAADSAMTVVDDVCFALIAYDATTWYTLPLLPS